MVPANSETRSADLGTRYWALGTGRWALGTGHWALGAGHWSRREGANADAATIRGASFSIRRSSGIITSGRLEAALVGTGGGFKAPLR